MGVVDKIFRGGSGDGGHDAARPPAPARSPVCAAAVVASFSKTQSLLNGRKKRLSLSLSLSFFQVSPSPGKFNCSVVVVGGGGGGAKL